MRYLPLTQADRGEMLAAIGADGIDALFADVPLSARLKNPVDLPRHMSEMAVETKLNALALRNVSAGQAAFFWARVPTGIIFRQRLITSFSARSF